MYPHNLSLRERERISAPPKIFPLHPVHGHTCGQSTEFTEQRQWARVCVQNGVGCPGDHQLLGNSGRCL